MSTHVVYKQVPGSVPVNRGNWPPPEEACTKNTCFLAEIGTCQTGEIMPILRCGGGELLV